MKNVQKFRNGDLVEFYKIFKDEYQYGIVIDDRMNDCVAGLIRVFWFQTGKISGAVRGKIKVVDTWNAGRQHLDQ